MKPRILLLGLLLGGACSSCSPMKPDIFGGGDDLCNPAGRLVVSGHTIYGTTSDRFRGSVFKLSTGGGGFNVLHRFTPVLGPAYTNSDGGTPVAGLILSGDILYGTTQQAGNFGGGTVFKLKTSGGDFTVLHNFGGLGSGDGSRPMASVALSGNTLYGTTQRGGINNGTVFKVNTDGTGYAILHAFKQMVEGDHTNDDGAFPQTEVIVSGTALYGTAWAGGAGGVGTVFALNTDGSGFRVLHSFAKTIIDHSRSTFRTFNQDGAWLESGLVLSGDELYGAASQGGKDGSGTLFKIKTDGTDFTVLHSFSWIGIAYPDITNRDGGNPGNLILSGKDIYGAAPDGGPASHGRMFRIGTDERSFAVLSAFQATKVWPTVGLTRAGDTFYGTSAGGGKGGGGIVFKSKGPGERLTVLHSFVEKPLPPGLTD